MPEIKEWGKPLHQLLAVPDPSTAADAFEAKHVLGALMVWREHPALALQVLSGIEVPPNERILMDVVHRGAPSNVVIGSRGTAKTSTIALLYGAYKSLLFPKRKGVTLSASGFRGGQQIFTDLERWAQGGWVDQVEGLLYVRNSLVGDKPIKRAQNYWQAEFTSLSTMMTVPTNNPENLRGLRATDLYIDEANFTDQDLVDKVAASFLNVLQDFATGGENADRNVVFYTTTIDYSWRPFQKTAQAAYDSLQRELYALSAAEKGHMDIYEELEARGFHGSSYVNIDYTDTIMRRYITTRDGKRYEVHWPDENRVWREDPRGIPYTSRDENGHMKLQGDPVEVITTYPINRDDMEQKLLSGDVSVEVWQSEQRNVVDSSAGDVYAHTIVDEASCKGARYVIPWSECSVAYKNQYKDPERHYVPQVLWSCTDPCVLGVDYAPGSRDFCAFVVIRMGPLATAEFDPATGMGHTAWSNVIWTEQHHNATGDNVADKIRNLATRYNLYYVDDIAETDTWKLCRAIGIDVRGGGNAVRDSLVFINEDMLAEGAYRILDPLDDDPRLAAFKNDPRSRNMLDAIKPTGPLNDKLVEFTVGQMTQHLLYIPADVPRAERPLDRKYDIAYDGSRMLEHQLRALQQSPTASGYRKFFMSGDEESPSNKKDFWAAFIYASKQLRAHLLRKRLMDDTPPPMGALVHSGKFIGHGKRVPGTRL